MKVIVDTSAWYAFFIASDPYHSESKEFIKINPHLVTPFTIIEELAAVINNRQGKTQALKSVMAIQNMDLGGEAIHFITSEDQNEILIQFQNTPAYIDYVDASVLWLSRKLNLPVFTFDEHFRKLKIPVVP